MADIIRKPIITEKTSALAEALKSYSFEVRLNATKPEIKRAVELGFDVRVQSVRTLVCRGKWLKKQARFGPPRKWKKAIVTLAEGERIALFEGA